MEWEFTLVDSMGESTNGFYNPEKSRDGGGYWQYRGFCSYAVYEKHSPSPCVEHLMTFNVEDDSCGWFGSRLHAHIVTEQGEWRFSWGSMDGLDNEGRDKALAEISVASGVDEPTLCKILDKTFIAVSKQAQKRWNETRQNATKGGRLG